MSAAPVTEAHRARRKFAQRIFNSIAENGGNYDEAAHLLADSEARAVEAALAEYHEGIESAKTFNRCRTTEVKVSDLALAQKDYDEMRLRAEKAELKLKQLEESK